MATDGNREGLLSAVFTTCSATTKVYGCRVERMHAVVKLHCGELTWCRESLSLSAAASGCRSARSAMRLP